LYAHLINCMRIATVVALLLECAWSFVPAAQAQEVSANAGSGLLLGSGSRSSVQMPVPSTSGAPVPQPSSAISANELANLVAPIALYPDPLLSQVLVACTYPLEVVEVQQWLQQNENLHNRELMEAAKQQNWDPSVQGLVAFPEVVTLLNRNIRWTRSLGNAFLAQQSDVMNAIQSLRAQARGNGQLVSTPQLSINTEMQGDQSAIEIQPADPRTMYVPSYDPSAVWGAPVEGSYPALPYAGSGWQSLLGTVINLAGFLPGFPGLLGATSWGWALSWLAHALFVNNSFFSDFEFHNFSGGSGESSLWVHNAAHRSGVPYVSSLVASLYGGGTVPPRMAISFGQGGSAWRTFGGATQVNPVAQPRRPFAPHTSTGRQGFPRDNPTASLGHWRTFSSGMRMASAGQSGRAFSQPPWTTNGPPQPNHRIGRDPYFANSANSRVPSFTVSRSFASNYDGFGNPSTIRRPAPSRTVTSSSLRRSPHFSPPRMLSQHGSSWQHSFKPQHFSAPKFSVPHSSKSRGGGHSTWGHSGKKSHHK
jgi:Protein of unknown function (DUF3300)